MTSNEINLAKSENRGLLDSLDVRVSIVGFSAFATGGATVAATHFFSKGEYIPAIGFTALAIGNSLCSAYQGINILKNYEKKTDQPEKPTTNNTRTFEETFTELRQISDLERDIRALGFEGGILKTHADKSITLFGFKRESEGSVPQLDIRVDKTKHSYHVVVNSLPFKEEYRRNTSSPIKVDEVVGQIQQYIREVTR